MGVGGEIIITRQRCIAVSAPGTPGTMDSSSLDARRRLKANSHPHARHDKTVLSLSRPLRRRELDSRQLKIVAGRKYEV